MNERDIKNYFANASLSEQKKDQLKETLKKRFPQQNGDINRILSHHKPSRHSLP